MGLETVTGSLDAFVGSAIVAIRILESSRVVGGELRKSSLRDVEDLKPRDNFWTSIK